MTKTLCLLLAALLAGCGSDDAVQTPENFAKGPGPALTVPAAQLATALSCSSEPSTFTRDPVLLTPAFSTAEQSFAGYLAQLPALGIPVCSISLPDHGYADLQNAAEYVVYAVRRISAGSGRKLILFGHQHGPLDQLWALTFWPDLPAKVASLISLATPYQGTQASATLCNLVRNCSPAVWQIASGSQFTAALNASPLPAGLAVTSIATLFDEVIIPQPQASHRDGATNIVLQDLCPARLVEHFSILIDRLAYLLVLDAIEHPGLAADPARLAPGYCSGPATMPVPAGTPGLELLPEGGGFLVEFPSNNVTAGVAAEPALRDYALPR